MNKEIYSSRRKILRALVKQDAILFLGHSQASKNYAANFYPFRQNSHLLYYSGINLPDVALLILPDGREILFAPKKDPDDLIWTGPAPSSEEIAAAGGLEGIEEINALAGNIEKLKSQGVEIHYPPPYRGKDILALCALLALTPEEVKKGASEILAGAIVKQRSIKSPEEVEQIEAALAVTEKIFASAKDAIRPGVTESIIAGAIEGVALAFNRRQAFSPIATKHGEILHNESYTKTFRDNDMLLVDAGAESPMFYASDITRVFPVSGKFSDKQRDIYQIVLAAENAVIAGASPNVTNRELHHIAALTIATGLVGIGLMRGNPQEITEAGAHALFFPHGIGHMMGLDAHDMEDLGDIVGYAKGESRSEQFGLSFLRLAKKLEPGFVITVEPGIYFIPDLIYKWKSQEIFSQFINYRALGEFLDFGGIRIEDDILITEKGCRVLGPPIPKAINHIERG